MIKLNQATAIASDCTARYNVVIDDGCTVSDFISEVLQRREWGYIGILDQLQAWFEFGNPQCEYRYGLLLSELPTELMDKTIESASASGGWSRMDYKLKLKD